MKKRWISILAAAVLSVSAISGCGGAQNSGKESEEKSGDADQKKDAAGEKLTVLYMSGVYADAARSMVDEFEKKTGAKVEVIDMPYMELHEKMLLDLTSQSGTYDVIDVASQWDGEFAPYLTELQPYIDKDQFDMSAFIDNVLANSGKWQGSYYGIPNASTPQLFAYRTDLLPNGIADNWEDYRKQLEELNKPEEGFYGDSISGITGQLGGVFD